MHRSTQPFSRSCLLACLLALTILPGCGSEKYEQRLAQTVDYYRYQEKIRKTLSPAIFSEAGLTFQPPQGFELQTRDKDQTEYDSRLPSSLHTEIPGVVAVWKKDVALASTGEQGTTAPAYLVACSNSQAWSIWRTARNPEIADPLQFHNDLFFSLMSEVGISDLNFATKGPNLDLNTWKSGVVVSDNAKDTKYTPPKNYNVITLHNPELMYDGIPLDFQIFQYGSGDSLAAILLICPHNMSPAERVRENLMVALTTLNYQVPTAATTSSPNNPSSDTPARPRAGGGF